MRRAEGEGGCHDAQSRERVEAAAVDCERGGRAPSQGTWGAPEAGRVKEEEPLQVPPDGPLSC